MAYTHLQVVFSDQQPLGPVRVYIPLDSDFGSGSDSELDCILVGEQGRRGRKVKEAADRMMQHELESEVDCILIVVDIRWINWVGHRVD